MRRPLLGLALFLLAACSAGSSSDCDQRVKALEAWLATSQWEPAPMMVKGALPELPADLAPGSNPPYQSPMVIADRSSMFGGTRFGTDGPPDAQVAEAFGADLLARRQAAEGGGFDSVILLVPRDARWDLIVAAMEGAARAGLAVDLAFEAPRKLPRKPEPSPLGDRFAATPGDAIAQSRVTEELFAPCAPAIATFGKVAFAGDPRQKHEVLVQGVPRALRECSCKPSPEDARTWFWHTVLSSETPGFRVVRLRVTRSDDKQGVAIRAAADATWQQVLSKVLAAAQPGSGDRLVRFEVESGDARKR